MTNHESLMEAMAEVTGYALDGHGISIQVHGLSREQFLSFRDRYDTVVRYLGGDTIVMTADVFGELIHPKVELIVFLKKGVSLVDETGPLPADEVSEDPRDERFDREAGFYEGWKGPGDAA